MLDEDYIGKYLRILHMEGEPEYTGKEGICTSVDSVGQLHGTWGGLAIQPRYGDRFEVIEGKEVQA